VRYKLSVYTGVLAAVLLGVLLIGSAAGADGKRDRTLRLKAVEQQFEFVDVGDPGPSLGDQLVFSEILRKHGRRAGESGGVCTIVKAAPPYDSTQTHQCVITLRLRRGQITLQGLNEVQGETDPGPFKLAITGGTGAYTGASGKAVFRRRGAGRGVYTLHFEGKKQHRH
jgi:hypothetical protein